MPEEKHNPWESGLKERQQKEAREKAEKEAREAREAEEARQAERERLAAIEAARPKPSGPPQKEFLAQVAAAGEDKEAKLGLLKGRAADLFKQGFPEEATELYTLAINLAPSHALYGNRSACRAARGDYSAALDDANACIRLNSKWPKGYARKGAALHGLFRFDEAVKAYEEGLKHEPESAVLVEGLADAERRRKAAGGDWDVAVDGGRQIYVSTKDGDVKMDQIGGIARPTKGTGNSSGKGDDVAGPPLNLLVACPNMHVLANDGSRPKIFSMRTGMPAREFNTAHNGSGARTLNEPVSGLAIDPQGNDPAVYAIEPNKGKLYRLLIRDTRSEGCRKETPDKVLNEIHAKRELGMEQPRGACACQAHTTQSAQLTALCNATLTDRLLLCVLLQAWRWSIPHEWVAAAPI